MLVHLAFTVSDNMTFHLTYNRCDSNLQSARLVLHDNDVNDIPNISIQSTYARIKRL